MGSWAWPFIIDGVDTCVQQIFQKNQRSERLHQLFQQWKKVLETIYKHKMIERINDGISIVFCHRRTQTEAERQKKKEEQRRRKKWRKKCRWSIDVEPYSLREPLGLAPMLQLLYNEPYKA